VRVLVVDDDRSVREALSRALRLEGYTVELAPTGGDALAALAAEPVDVVVLDVGLPGLDGLETCRLVRAKGDSVPVLMLTARSGVSDRVAGLDAGADDYLVKPFALEELLARVRALLRRNVNQEPTDATAGATLSFGDLTLNPVTRDVRRATMELQLTRTEFSLLELLLRHPRQVMTREVIFDRVWGYDFGANSNSLEVYVGYLRRKTEGGGGTRLIHTVRGVGYVLREQAP
jgi:two-component system, OmpR family, response regulator MprA